MGQDTFVNYFHSQFVSNLLTLCYNDLYQYVRHDQWTESTLERHSNLSRMFNENNNYEIIFLIPVQGAGHKWEEGALQKVFCSRPWGRKRAFCWRRFYCWVVFTLTAGVTAFVYIHLSFLASCTIQGQLWVLPRLGTMAAHYLQHPSCGILRPPRPPRPGPCW